jgi:hypothetical protein
MRTSMIVGTVLLSFTASCLTAGENAPPPLAPDAAWTADKSNTRTYPDWLHLGREFRPELRSILSSEAGNLQYWIRVAKGARGTIAVAVGEAYWAEPGHRLMDVRIDGRTCASRIDPIAVAGGKHRLAVIACEAEDVDGDGLLHVQIVASKDAPDHVTLAAGLWWFAGKLLTAEQVAELPRVDHKLKPDLFICHGLDVSPWKERFARQIHTDDEKLNALIESLYDRCVWGALREPRPPALPNRWITGGGGYVGQWLWDAMFVTTAFAPLDDDATIRGVFDNYWYTIDHNPEAPKGSFRYGMVPNYLGPWPPLGYSQIPILGWGCRMVYRQTNDRALVERCLPYLDLFDQWYSSERDVDGDGLIEFGAYKPVGNAGMLQTARYETFDFHPPMDDMKLTPHPQRPDSGPWYGNVEGVEQTCFLLMSEEAIAELAAEFGKQDLAEKYRRIVARRIKAVQEKMWDPQTQFFHSLDRDSHAKLPVRTIQGFLTLACGAATRDQAAALVKQLQDPKQWWTTYPVPTVALDDPKFGANAMWRGDMWPATTYLVACGLHRYGYHDVARQLAERMRRLIAEHGINERYNALTGQAIGDPGVAMTCSAWPLLVQSVYGVQDDFRTIVVPPGAKGRRLHLGKLQVSYPDDDIVEVRTAFQRQFRLVVAGTDGPLHPALKCDGQPAKDGAVKLEDGAITFTAQAGRTYSVHVHQVTK